MATSTALESVFDVESFINEYYDAWSGTDEDRIMSYYAENVALHIPGALMAGKEAVREQFVRPFITAFPGNHHRVKNMIFGTGVVTVEFSFEAQHKGHSAAIRRPVLESNSLVVGFISTIQRNARSLPVAFTSM